MWVILEFFFFKIKHSRSFLNKRTLKERQKGEDKITSMLFRQPQTDNMNGNSGKC